MGIRHENLSRPVTEITADEGGYGVRRIGNSVDIIIPTGKASFRYQDRCFLNLAAMHSDRTWIGPNMVDRLFGRMPYCGLIRPDAIQFIVTDTWQLAGLAEFKTGHHNGTERKLAGFSDLLVRLRRDSDAVSGELSEFIDSDLETVIRFQIPRDQRITVYMISPYNHEDTRYTGDAAFSVRYLKMS